VPLPPILVGQQHQFAAGGGPGPPPRLDQKHEGKEAHDLRFVGHELGQQPAQADCLGAEVLTGEPVADAGGVAFVEDEVNDSQHRPEPIG
jgi:hypothetical protein